MYNSVQISKSDMEASNRIFPANHNNASPFHLIQTTHLTKKKWERENDSLPSECTNDKPTEKHQ